ncbi:nmrA-like family domain-containing protein 1 [Mercenaria mercenaria]|uniref:nmrA-like family domain-containing protein 1 n=1 Tax=Mercenaria mercenaria TaxID=6596 RepID=UPI001E1D8D82|nr:nmrA-like family domain-containing protein 1 [Mercenaria mercenaria]
MFGCYGRANDDKYRMGCGSSKEFPDDEPRTVVVFGATGLLGGSVARALLEDPLRFRVRAVTRRPSSEKARKLAEEGAVIVTANQNDIASLEKALDGADSMFLTTHYWEDKNKEKEIVRGLNAIDAAVHKGLTHIVFNGSENVRKTIGKDCGHLDSKAAIEEYLREVGVNYTIIRLPFWYENFTTVFRPHKVKHGVYAIPIPMEDMPLDMISVTDVGECVMKLFYRPRYYSRKTLSFGGDRLTTEEMAHALTKCLNKKFIYPKLRIKDFEQFDFPGSQELAAMFEFYQKAQITRDIKLTKRLNPEYKTFEKWLDEEMEAVENALKEQDQ